MRTRANLTEKDATISVQIPLRLRQRGGRKFMIAPDGATSWSPPRAQVDSAMVKAIARAHRWRRMLESGIYVTISELAAAEKINQSYVCRVLRLTLLAPDTIEKILDGQQPPVLQLPMLLKPLPIAWHDQRGVLGTIG
jgi:hypothetical protein